MTARCAAWFGFAASAICLVSNGPVFAEPPGPKPDLTLEEIKARVEAIKPLPLTPIPDDPPPHEGAMIGLPCVVEPPDLLLVEVLEALPGHPISGERLVRPDGTITLGFYGEVDVKGLTLPQVKVKVVESLRRYLPDSVLGLEEDAFEEGPPAGAPTPPGQPNGPQEKGGDPPIKVAPADSNKVFVGVASYNSKYYYVQGDVANPGRLNWTGNETVLDALNFSGFLLPTADRKRITLVRPARAGKAAKVYPIDLQAITEKGDHRATYQLFPGDRLVVGRNALIQQTILVVRLSALNQTLVNGMLTASFMARSLAQATPDLNAGQREALLKDWFDLWWKAAGQPGGPAPDEKAFRELLLRLFKTPAPPVEKK